MAFGNVRSGYPLPLSVARLFGQPIVVVNAAALNRSPWYEVRNEASKVINDMGIGSAIAQGLVGRSGPNPITEVHRLGETDARVYLLAQQEPGHPPVAVGLLKVDVLALGMLTALRKAMALLGDKDGRAFCMQDIPDNDGPTYKSGGPSNGDTSHREKTRYRELRRASQQENI